MRDDLECRRLDQECWSSSVLWWGGLVGIKALGWAVPLSPRLLPAARTVLSGWKLALEFGVTLVVPKSGREGDTERWVEGHRGDEEGVCSSIPRCK